MKTTSLLLASSALLALSVPNASAQENAYFWGYYGTGTTIGITFSDTAPIMTNAHYQEIGGVDMSDSQLARWQHLFYSGYLFGSNTSMVRGWDLTEDWDLNWSTPALYDETIPSRWVSIEFSGTSAEFFWKNTANQGEYPNQPFLGNPNVIALVDDYGIFLNSDNTLSGYSLNGAAHLNYGWTTLTGGGTLDDVEMSAQLLKEQFIGSEELQIAFLVGEDTVDFYNLLNGTYIRSADYSGVTQGPLALGTLADLVDGKIDGWTYIGMDSIGPGPVFVGIQPIPEPGTWMLLGGGLALLLYKSRRRNQRA